MVAWPTGLVPRAGFVAPELTDRSESPTSLSIESPRRKYTMYVCELLTCTESRSHYRVVGAEIIDVTTETVC